ncbi:MAG: Na/Pi cotransporter family protein [Peptoniphilaceae bacterium]
MSITYIFSLLGGLVLFLYGMDLMSSALELVAGNKMNRVIEKLTSNPLKGVAVGAAVTAVIQSSSATTVMVVGFVNAGLMNIYQAVGVIMGANVGTTITGQLVALNITDNAPIMAFIGFVMLKGLKKDKLRYSGQVILGLGMLFMGMEIMSSSMAPLKNDPSFISLMTMFKNPILGVIAGAIFTAIIQSSSSSLGILQAISNQGLISLSSSMYIICGFNIGTCITSVLSSIGASKNAQRTSAVHVWFNLIGTFIFIIITLFLPIDEFVSSFSGKSGASQIANMHTLFNISTTIILFPFYKKLANLAVRTVKGKDGELEPLSLKYITDRKMVDPNLALTNTRAEANRMLDLAKQNFNLSIEIFKDFNESKYDIIFHNEEIINYLNSNITKYIIDVLGKRMDDSLASMFTGYMRVVRDIERMGDHIKSIAEFSKLNKDRDLVYTDESTSEMLIIEKEIEEMFKVLYSKIPKEERIKVLRNSNIEVENQTNNYRNRHMERMKTGSCDPESGILYEKMLISLERVSAYLSNTGKLII